MLSVLIEAISHMAPDAALPETVLPGEPPSAIDLPTGCAFHPRCPHATAACRADPPPTAIMDGPVEVWCHLYPSARDGGGDNDE